MTIDVLQREIFIGGVTKFQYHKRLSKHERDGDAAVSHEIDFDAVETFLL